MGHMTKFVALSKARLVRRLDVFSTGQRSVFLENRIDCPNNERDPGLVSAGFELGKQIFENFNNFLAIDRFLSEFNL